MTLKHFIIDVDGVMTTGQFIYTAEGKIGKIFGPHDSDGLKLIKHRINVQFITADWRGFDISKKRIYDDMGYNITMVYEETRDEYLAHLGYDQIVFMGDGIYDAACMKKCAYSIAPASARIEAREAATYVTPSKAAEGAVLDACLWLKDILNAQS